MSAGIYIDIDGAPVDLAHVDWFEEAPCGCVCGATAGYINHERWPAPRVVATAEQAKSQFWDTRAERDKCEAQGFTVFPDLRSKVRELMTDCAHEPKWGVEPRPQMDGYTWAAVQALGSRSSLMHLVPTMAVKAAADRDFSALNVKPLCGGRAAFWWKDEWHALDGKVECKRCENKASKAARS